MSARQLPPVEATAFQLLGALDAYEREMAALWAQRGVVDGFQALSDRMDQMRLHALQLPHVAAPWVEVMIRHFEVTHRLWHVHVGKAPASELTSLRKQHALAVQNLRHRLLADIVVPPR